MAYSDKVLDHYSNPKNVGTLDKSKSNVGTGLVGAPECGDVMRLQIEVVDNIITDAKFKTFGCGSAIASSSVATEWLKGKTLDEAITIDNMDLVEELNLPCHVILLFYTICFNYGCWSFGNPSTRRNRVKKIPSKLSKFKKHFYSFKFMDIF